MLSPKIEIIQSVVQLIGPDPVEKEKNLYRIKIGVANTGFLPTNVSEMATKVKAVLPLMIEISTINEKVLQVSYSFTINLLFHTHAFWLIHSFYNFYMLYTVINLSNCYHHHHHRPQMVILHFVNYMVNYLAD